VTSRSKYHPCSGHFDSNTRISTFTII